MSACEKAKELGAHIDGGMNWTWANGFTEETAKEFIAWLDANGFEHRGIYRSMDVENLRDVRFR